MSKHHCSLVPEDFVKVRRFKDEKDIWIYLWSGDNGDWVFLTKEETKRLIKSLQKKLKRLDEDS